MSTWYVLRKPDPKEGHRYYSYTMQFTDGRSPVDVDGDSTDGASWYTSEEEAKEARKQCAEPDWRVVQCEYNERVIA